MSSEYIQSFKEQSVMALYAINFDSNICMILVDEEQYLHLDTLELALALALAVVLLFHELTHVFKM